MTISVCGDAKHGNRGSPTDESTAAAPVLAQVWLYHQTGNTNQQWITRPFGGGVQIVNPASGLCLDAGSALPPPCAAGQPAANLPICNASLPLPERVASVVSNLSQAESIPLFNTASKGVVRLGINPWEWWSEALHGVANSPGVHFTNAIPGATSFPQVMSTADVEREGAELRCTLNVCAAFTPYNFCCATAESPSPIPTRRYARPRWRSTGRSGTASAPPSPRRRAR